MNDKVKTPRLDLTDRFAIEIGLSKSENLSIIAKRIKRHPATVSREIRVNRTLIRASYPFGCDCLKARTCGITNVCGRTDCRMYCHSCTKGCSNYCSEYRSIACKKHEKPPYVCNSCDDRKNCVHEKYFYSSKRAQALSERRNSDSHKGIRIKGEEFDKMNSLVSELIKKGQPISHIVATNRDKIPVSERSLYNYILRGKLKVKQMDLRRQVKYRKRRKQDFSDEKVPNAQRYRIGRTFTDFLEYMKDKPDSIVVEMDTVKGSKGSSTTLLTMLLRCNMVMLIFLMPDGTQSSVVRVFDYLETGLGTERFRRLFSVFLTDNGSEFKDNDGLELNSELETRARVYYCDPMASWQKGKLEKNHEYIRYVIPKGTNLSQFTEDDITLLTNHINSTRRKSLGGNAPYDMVLPEDEDMKALMKLLRLKQIHPLEVYLNRELLKLDK